MTTLAQIAAYPLAHALGWTLLHFCWQGAAVAALLWCVLGALGRSSSRTRYAASGLGLALIALLPLLTFARLAVQDYRLAMLTRNAPIEVSTLFVQADAAGPLTPWPLRLATVLDHSVPWVLAVWLAGVVLFLARLNLGLLAARRMSSDGTAVSPDLQHLFRQLCVHLGIHRAVRLLHSASVQVPTVIGWLRPVVLLPASCLSGLSPSQIEALLCHELAHVRRHDYLVSVLQSVVETLLFYHPAVWWVSKQVRRERECCCDELAVSNGGDILAYARALSWLEEQRACTPQLVLGANGGVLAMRIRRLLGYPESSAASQFASMALLAVIALAGLAFFGRLAYAESAASYPAPSSPIASQAISQPAPPQSTTVAPGSAAADEKLSGADQVQQANDQTRQINDQARRLHDVLNALEQLKPQQDPPRAQPGQARLWSAEDQQRIDEAKRQLQGEIDRLNNPQYRKEMAGALAALAKINSPEFKERLKNQVGIPELKKQAADAQAAMAKLDTAGLYKQMEAVQAATAEIDTAELHKQMVDAMAALARVKSPELRKQLDDATKSVQQLNTPEYKKQMEQLLAQRSLFAQESAPPATPAARVSVSPQNVLTLPAGAVRGNLIHSVDPVYPSIAKAAHVQGVVVLHARISKEGTVEVISPVSGPPMLQASAVNAVRQWTFKPYVVGGEPVAVHTTISVNFTFGGDSQTQKSSSQTAQTSSIGIGVGDGSRPVYPPTDSAGNPVRKIGGSVSVPQVISQVEPEFSTEARKAKFMGNVVVGCIVNEQGLPEDVHIVRGVGMGLNDKAVEAVKQYRFAPALENGVPVPVELNIEVNFRIF